MIKVNYQSLPVDSNPIVLSGEVESVLLNTDRVFYAIISIVINIYSHSYALPMLLVTVVLLILIEIADQGVNYILEWSIIARGKGFNPTTRSCQICLREKYFIMFRPEGATLNSRDELFNTCRHRTKLLLSKT